MKFALVLLAVLFGIWLWRSGRGDKAQTPKAPKPPALQDMVSCAVCALHLPQNDALKGQGRSGTGQTAVWYCCREHRQRGKG